MKNIRISNFSIYSDGFYNPDEVNFIKLYKGVRVNVNSCEDGKYMYFSIRTRKVKTAIRKGKAERMDSLVFDDMHNSITCVFENDPKNKCPHTLEFGKDIYDDLKKNIPEFIRGSGGEFDILETSGRFVMEF